MCIRDRTYTFEIRQTLYNERISLDDRCRTLDDFLALSDNKFTPKPLSLIHIFFWMLWPKLRSEGRFSRQRSGSRRSGDLQPHQCV